MYYVVYGFLWLISLLPLGVLYLLSDAVYGLLYYIVGYRKEIVMQNLTRVFPEKTEAEKKKIAKKFYRNLTDTFIETIKMISASEKYILKRFDCNWDVVNRAAAGGRTLQMHIGHNFNWEWGNAIAAKRFVLPVVVVYMPIENKIFERLFRNLRSRWGSSLVKATNMREEFLPYRNKQVLLGLVADQNPGNPASAWWFDFFGHPTPFVKGPGKGAVVNNASVIFGFIHKKKRGHYEGILHLAVENPNEITEEEMTRRFVRYLEQVIRDHPDMWLWSHRRWKHQWKEEYGPVLK
jgi:KDO2-lipid IV(A) lauroyltransferase